MKFIEFRHIKCIFRILPLLVGALIASCSHSVDPNIPEVALDDICVSFRIKANDAASRAVDEYGTLDESHIDLNNLKILIFDKDGKLKDVIFDNGVVNDVKNTSVVPFGYGMYLVKAKLNPELYSLNSEFVIVAIANWKTSENDKKLITDWNGHKIDSSEIGNLTIDDLKSAVFTLNPKTETATLPESWIPGGEEDSSEGRWIPMFGSRFAALKGYDSSKFNESNPMPISDIDLVRAFSKIEVVNLDTGEDCPEITSITLNNRNINGRLMQNYNFLGATTNVPAPTLDGFAITPDTDPLPFHKEGNKYVVYFPEMELPNEDSRRAICINLKMHNVDHQKWIYLAPYNSNGIPNLTGPYTFDWANVKRNYIYRYEINSLAFEFIISVEPWKYGGKVHIPLE